MRESKSLYSHWMKVLINFITKYFIFPHPNLDFMPNFSSLTSHFEFFILQKYFQLIHGGFQVLPQSWEFQQLIFGTNLPHFQVEPIGIGLNYFYLVYHIISTPKCLFPSIHHFPKEQRLDFSPENCGKGS